MENIEEYAKEKTDKFSNDNDKLTPHKIEKILEEKFHNVSHEDAIRLVKIWSKDLKENIDIAYMLSGIREGTKGFIQNYFGYKDAGRRYLNEEFGHSVIKNANLITKDYLLAFRRKSFHKLTFSINDIAKNKVVHGEKIEITQHKYLYYLLSDLEKLEDLVRNNIIYATKETKQRAKEAYFGYFTIVSTLMGMTNEQTFLDFFVNVFGVETTIAMLGEITFKVDYYDRLKLEFNKMGIYENKIDTNSMLGDFTNQVSLFNKFSKKVYNETELQQLLANPNLVRDLWKPSQVLNILKINEDDALRYDLVVLYPEIIQKQYETKKISKSTLYRRLGGTVSIKKIQNRRQQQRFRDGKRAFKYLNKNKLILRELPKEIEKVQDELKNSQLDEKKKTAKEKQLNTKIKQLDKLNKGFKELTKKEVCENMATYKSRNANKEIESMTRPTLDKYLFEYYVVEYKRLSKQKNGKSLELTDIEHVAEYLFLKPNQLIKLIKKYNNRIKN